MRARCNGDAVIRPEAHSPKKLSYQSLGSLPPAKKRCIRLGAVKGVHSRAWEPLKSINHKVLTATQSDGSRKGNQSYGTIRGVHDVEEGMFGF